MLRVVETFSGIGSQVKALKNLNIAHEIVATVEWNITAIYAYDIIHNGKQTNNDYKERDKNELVDILSSYTLSGDGKDAITRKSLNSMSKTTLSNLIYAIERTKNLVSITDVKATTLPENIDVLTYSFPCQDLSVCGAWHGNTSGIDRNANNRSGMLWEVERILKEYVEEKISLPKFLLMENVSNILSEAHRDNFKEWQNYLTSIGYYNKIYTLNALDFGIPQSRKRTYMISVLINDKDKEKALEQYFFENNLSDVRLKLPNILDYLRISYENPIYRSEADISNPNDTPSRNKIYEDNQIIWHDNKVGVNYIKTITTKQDRNPNSGVIDYVSGNSNKAKYRNLTPRECFLFMGFEEKDFQLLVDNNFETRANTQFFTREKLVKLAGNSIVVPVLEKIFEQIDYINKNIT